MLLLPDKQGKFHVPLLKTKVEQDFTHLPVLPDKQGKFYVPLFNSKSGTSHQEAESRRGQYTAGGEISDTLFFRDSVSEPEIGHAPPCCTQTQDPNQPPAGRPPKASSVSEMRTCASAFAPSDVLRAVSRHEKARQGNGVPQRA